MMLKVPYIKVNTDYVFHRLVFHLSRETGVTFIFLLIELLFCFPSRRSLFCKTPP